MAKKKVHEHTHIVEVAGPAEVAPAPVTMIMDWDKQNAYAAIREGMKTDAGYTHLPEDVLAQLDPALIETAPSVRDAQNNVAVVLTEQGLMQVGPGETTAPIEVQKPVEQVQEVVHTKPVTTNTNFQLEDNIEIPKFTRSPKYPFQDMQVGQSFFVPATETHPDARKAVTPSTSNANKSMKGTAHFKVRKVEGGARVWRVS